MSDDRIFTLLQLNSALRKRIEQATQGRSYWVKAEIAGISHQRHMYLDLVEHRNGVRVAVMRGIIWQQWLAVIQRSLGDEFPHVLKEGAEILFRATVQFDPVHGLGLFIDAVDLAYSLGELERRKQATVATLKAEGLFDLNRSVHEGMVLQRIALVTSPGSAAFADFMEHLKANDHGYQFHVQFYASAVQGESAPAELRRALAAIDPSRFDAVVIIRGGGSKLDLDAFNDLELCRLVARMPIPVMTGIGHDTDVSVLDLIAKGAHKTPTAIADHLVDRSLFFETGLNAFLVGMQRVMGEVFSDRKERLSAFGELLRQRPAAFCQLERGALHGTVMRFARDSTDRLRQASRALEQCTHDLGALPQRRLRQVEVPRLRELHLALDRHARHGLSTLQERLSGMEEAIRLLDPDRALARGFTITRFSGRAIIDAQDLRPGDTIETTFAHGHARSIITTVDTHVHQGTDL